MVKSKKKKKGSIYYDKKDNKFRCTYYIIDKNTAEEMRKSKSFDSEQEAIEFLNALQCQKGNTLFDKNNGIPLNQLMKSLAKRKIDMNTIKKTQYNRILASIKKLEETPITHKNIDDITSDEIQAYLNSLKKYSQSSISKIKNQFSQAFNYALNKGYILQNPMIDVIEPKSEKPPKVIRALEIDEQQIITNYLMNIPTENDPYKVAYLLQLYLGLRIGEALALQVSDINLDRNLVHISKTLTFDENNTLIMGNFPKSFAGIRDIPIPEFIKNEIINQMILAGNHKDKLLFVNTKNNFVDPKNANKFLKKTLKNVNITDITTHSLRHTYGTRCIEAGMRAVALQRLMGHSDISVTLNIYVSIFNKYKQEELEKVNEYYMSNCIIEPTEQFLDKQDNTIKQIYLPLKEQNNNIENNIEPTEPKLLAKEEDTQKLLQTYQLLFSAIVKGTVSLAELKEKLNLKENEIIR